MCSLTVILFLLTVCKLTDLAPAPLLSEYELVSPRLECDSWVLIGFNAMALPSMGTRIRYVTYIVVASNPVKAKFLEKAILEYVREVVALVNHLFMGFMIRSAL